MIKISECLKCTVETEWSKRYELEHRRFWQYRKALIFACDGDMKKVKDVLDCVEDSHG